MIDALQTYLPYALITTFTPGPNNLMSLYSVSSGGWKKGARVIFGIFTGFSVIMLAVIVFCSELAKHTPEFVKYLKYVGAAYILWLAFHIAMSKPSESSEKSLLLWGLRYYGALPR